MSGSSGGGSWASLIPLGPFWAHPQTSALSPVDDFEGPGGTPEASWGHLGASWGFWGAFGAFGARLGVLRQPFRTSWRRLGASWRPLGPSWADLGRDLGASGTVLGRPGWPSTQKLVAPIKILGFATLAFSFLKILLFRGPVLVSPGHALAKARCGFRNLFDAHTACSRKLALQARWALRCAQGAGRGIRDEEAGNGTLWGEMGEEWNPAAGNGRGTGGERVRGAGTGEGQKAVWRSRIRF